MEIIMEPKTAEEILEIHTDYFETVRPEHAISVQALHADTLKAMREYAQQAVRMALDGIILELVKEEWVSYNINLEKLTDKIESSIIAKMK